MNYKQRYKEAIERAKKCFNPKEPDSYTCIVESIFSKLKESEDERIRKALLEMVHDTTGDDLWIDYNVHKEDALAWLEKQKDKKDIHLLELKAKAYDDARERMSYAYNQNRVPIGFISEIFSNLNSYKNQDDKPQGKSALEAFQEEIVDNTNKVVSYESKKKRNE